MDGSAKAKGHKIELAVSKGKGANPVPGRREFFQYRDLGVTDATKGKMRAQLTSARAGMNRPTGWHYHICEAQFVYMVKGWMELEFEGRGVVRLEAGDSVLIPGGHVHNENCASDDFELIEVSIPAEMGTVACEAPAECQTCDGESSNSSSSGGGGSNLSKIPERIVIVLSTHRRRSSLMS